jgi:subtilisin family serine protease
MKKKIAIIMGILILMMSLVIQMGFDRASKSYGQLLTGPSTPNGEKQLLKIRSSLNHSLSIDRSQGISSHFDLERRSLPIGAKIPNQYIAVIRDIPNSSTISTLALPHDPGSLTKIASKRATLVQSVADFAASKGASVFRTYNFSIPGFAFVVPDKQSLAAVLRDPRIISVEQDQVQGISGYAPLGQQQRLQLEQRLREQLQLQQLPTEPQLVETQKKQPPQTFSTGFDRIDADLNPATTGTAPIGSGIAIIDTGIDLAHPDLNVYRDVNVIRPDKSGNDDNGHGTFVAGIVAAENNEIGVIGVAPGARLWAVKVLDKNGVGTTSDVIAGIDYVTANAGGAPTGIDVANISFGCRNCISDAEHLAIQNSVAAGLTYVVSAGNDGEEISSTDIPASYPEVITVSAMADSDGKCGGRGLPLTPSQGDDTFAIFSNFGRAVDIMAPGAAIYSTFLNGGYITADGTSASAPFASGGAALIKASNHDFQAKDVKNLLQREGSKPNTICDGNGHGYLVDSRTDPDGQHEPLLYARNLGTGQS